MYDCSVANTPIPETSGDGSLQNFHVKVFLISLENLYRNFSLMTKQNSSIGASDKPLQLKPGLVGQLNN